MYTAPTARHGTDSSWRLGSPGRYEADPDARKGALEGDRPGDEQQGNQNVPSLDPEGQPEDWTKICEDVFGANEDESQG